MSKLKISDLSFYETEIPNDMQIQGGSVEPPLPKSVLDFLQNDIASLDRNPDDSSLEKEIIDEVGNKYRISWKKTKHGRALAIAGIGGQGDPKFASSSSVSVHATK